MRTSKGLVISLLLAGAAQAEERSNVLTLVPFGVELGATASVEYERRILPFASLQVTGTLVTPNPFVDDAGGARGLGYTLYTRGEAFRGLYLALGADAALLVDAGAKVGLWGDLGYKWLFENGLVLGAGGGVGVPIYLESVEGGSPGLAPRMLLEVGGGW